VVLISEHNHEVATPKKENDRSGGSLQTIPASRLQQHWMLRARRMQMALTFFLVADLA